MAKKTRKARKGKSGVSSNKAGHSKPAEILQQFKANWKAGEWELSLT